MSGHPPPDPEEELELVADVGPDAELEVDAGGRARRRATRAVGRLPVVAAPESRSEDQAEDEPSRSHESIVVVQRFSDLYFSYPSITARYCIWPSAFPPEPVGWIMSLLPMPACTQLHIDPGPPIAFCWFQ